MYLFLFLSLLLRVERLKKEKGRKRRRVRADEEKSVLSCEFSPPHHVSPSLSLFLFHSSPAKTHINSLYLRLLTTPNSSISVVTLIFRCVFVSQKVIFFPFQRHSLSLFSLSPTPLFFNTCATTHR